MPAYLVVCNSLQYRIPSRIGDEDANCSNSTLVEKETTGNQPDVRLTMLQHQSVRSSSMENLWNGTLKMKHWRIDQRLTNFQKRGPGG
mmetsp:Transcript_3592/g.6812  ORF Transcript_3592/g.6812 Transcript_3592/m.6812 type:complete len:88 (-) Transcript_3592:233-496(-)